MGKKIVSLLLALSLALASAGFAFAEELVVAVPVENAEEAATPEEAVAEEAVAPEEAVAEEPAAEVEEAPEAAETAETAASEEAVEVVEAPEEDAAAESVAEEVVEELEPVEEKAEGLLERSGSTIAYTSKGDVVEITDEDPFLLKYVESGYGPDGEAPLRVYSGCPSTAVVGQAFEPGYMWQNAYGESQWQMSIFLNGKLIKTGNQDTYYENYEPVILTEAGTCTVTIRVIDGLNRVVDVLDTVRVTGPQPLKINQFWVTDVQTYGPNSHDVSIALDYTGGMKTLEYCQIQIWSQGYTGEYYMTWEQYNWSLKESSFWIGEDGYHFFRVILDDGENTVTMDTAPFLVGENIAALPGQNGLIQGADGVWRYYKSDVFQKDFSGVLWFNGGYFFLADGCLCSDANGLAMYDGEWYFLANGQVQSQYTGLALYDGHWFYVENGRFYDSLNGIVGFDGGWFVVAAGELIRSVNGLWQNVDGRWYFVSEGQVQTQYTGLALYDGAWFYVEDGELAEWYTGAIEYNGVYFWVENGRLY